MAKIQVYEPALCCSSGVCGAEVDPRLVAFSADAEWARQLGATVERFNLAQQPMAFVNDVQVTGFLERSGAQGLPVIVVDGGIALSGRYPSRAELAGWAGLPEPARAAQAGCCSGDRCG